MEIPAYSEPTAWPGILHVQSPKQRKSPATSPEIPPLYNSAKNRGKMVPIILILNGWEMAFAFQHEMCLKISCEFQPEVENSSTVNTAPLGVSLRTAFIPRSES